MLSIPFLFVSLVLVFSISTGLAIILLELNAIKSRIKDKSDVDPK